MTIIHAITIGLACLAAVACASSGPDTIGRSGQLPPSPVPNTLTDAEKKAGWTLLFDGQSLEHFRGYKKPAMPDAGWAVKDGTLWRPPGQGGGDIITREKYQDFEFACDWKVSPKGNSGIIYRCTEEHDYCWMTGLEMQILDDAGHGDGLKPNTRAGSLYDLVPCPPGIVRPAGEWNTSKVVCKGTTIEHWLNGVKVVDTDITSDKYKEAWRQSKWPSMPDTGTRLRGHIALQDHGDEVWFRNIKVRPLD